MALTRPSTALSQKSNVNPSVNRQQEATAEDFNETGDLLNEYANAIEALDNSASANPYYGSWETLAALQAAHTDALDNGWAIIDIGAGTTPQIAAWDNINDVWVLTGAATTTTLTIIIDGAEFLLIKNKSIPNTATTLQSGDIIKGFTPPGNYIEAKYITGDTTDFENENVYKIFTGI